MHIIQNGVPENIFSWVQEIGRAGRDGEQSQATILFRRGDISHANAWILNIGIDVNKFYLALLLVIC